MFSYDDYREIIQAIQESGRGMNYHEALGKDSFVIMRHDVEYSVRRAYELSLVESEMGFSSTWFFQCTNNAYNIFSRQSKAMINDMRERGHIIGLHYGANGLTDMQQTRIQIQKELDICTSMFGYEFNEFSAHRPSKEILAENIKLPGIINAYQDDFFSFEPEVTDDTVLDVKYMSDANHIWRYGYPTRENILNNKKVQILTHPFAWCEHGYDNKDNYASMIQEMYSDMIDTIDGECKDFKEYIDDFKNSPTLVSPISK